MQGQLLPLSLSYLLPGSYSLGTRAHRAPTIVQPLHRLSLGSLRCQRFGTGTSPAECTIPYVRLQELPRCAQGLAPVASESAYPCHRINPASTLRAGQTYSNQHASNRRRRACRHRSSHDARDQAWPARRSSARRTRPLHRPHRHSDKLQGSDAPPPLTKCHVANACIAPVPPFYYKRE